MYSPEFGSSIGETLSQQKIKAKAFPPGREAFRELGNLYHHWLSTCFPHPEIQHVVNHSRALRAAILHVFQPNCLFNRAECLTENLHTSKASAEFWICNVLKNFALRERFSFVSARHLFEMQANMVSQIGSSSNYAMHYHFQLAKEALPPRLCEWELSTRNMSPECCYTPTVCINNFAYPFLNEQFARLAPKRFGNAARRSLIKNFPRAG